MSQRASAWTIVAGLPRHAGRGLVLLYRYTLAGMIGPRCRHLPSCSEFADEAIARFGLWAGGWMALARILRCHSLGTSGLDFVPAALPSRAHWWIPWRYGRWRGTKSSPDPQ
jgi:putative membrane protein insertion efficiency factor